MSDKPKRPLSAYMLWLNSARESIKRENPGIKVTEVAKRGGELWRAMKDKSVSTLGYWHPKILTYTTTISSFDSLRSGRPRLLRPRTTTIGRSRSSRPMVAAVLPTVVEPRSARNQRKRWRRRARRRSPTRTTMMRASRLAHPPP